MRKKKPVHHKIEQSLYEKQDKHLNQKNSEYACESYTESGKTENNYNTPHKNHNY